MGSSLHHCHKNQNPYAGGLASNVLILCIVLIRFCLFLSWAYDL
jgi:hypothetical protein